MKRKRMLFLSCTGKKGKPFPKKPMNGLINEFYPSGKIKSEYTLKDGNFNGFYKEYFENGKIRMEGTAVEGEWDGPLKYYSENGSLSIEMRYDKGKFLEETRFYDSAAAGDIKPDSHKAG